MTIAVTGFNGKLGSLLIRRPDFIPLHCDITNQENIEGWLNKITKEVGEPSLIVNLAAISSIPECEKNYEKAIKVNFGGAILLHKVFGKNILHISSDHVFSRGILSKPPKENAPYNPQNSYGLTKVAMEGAVLALGGKILRLSRTVSIKDEDISNYRAYLKAGVEVEVPTFFTRNYLHKWQAVSGIQQFAKLFPIMPDILHYGGTDNVSMYDLIYALTPDNRKNLVKKRKKYLNLDPRPKLGGLDISKAISLGFPEIDLDEVVKTLRMESSS